jgi:hypothetical protein
MITDLRHLSLELNRLTESMVEEAISDLLKKYGYTQPVVRKLRKDLDIEVD